MEQQTEYKIMAEYTFTENDFNYIFRRKMGDFTHAEKQRMLGEAITEMWLNKHSDHEILIMSNNLTVVSEPDDESEGFDEYESIIERIDEAQEEALGAPDEEYYTEWLETLECGDVHQAVSDFKGDRNLRLHLEKYISQALTSLYNQY